MHPRAPVITNLPALKTAAIEACDLYIAAYEDEHRSPSNSIFDNRKGYHRAQKLKAYLSLENIDNLNVFTLILAVVGRPSDGIFGFVYGRSSELVENISSKCIPGRKVKDTLMETDENTLEAKVFSQESLDGVAQNPKHQNSSKINFAEADHIFSFSKVRGTRDLLDHALDVDFRKVRNVVLTHLPRIQAKLEDASPHTNLDLSILIPKKFFDAIKLGAMIRFFAKIPNEKKPIAKSLVITTISSYTTLSDSISIANTCKAAGGR